MATHWVIDALAEIVAPTRCAGCERCGTVLCDSCMAKVELYATQKLCPRCAAPYGRLVCTECNDEEFSFTGTVSCGLLADELARAVVIYKDGFERRLGTVFGDLLAGRLALRIAAGLDEPFDIVTWIPPTKRALNRRGFDHAGILAVHVARCFDVPFEQVLIRSPMRDLRTLSRADRALEVQASYRFDEDMLREGASPIAGKRILLVDDVFTTGATLEGATTLLLDVDAASVRCAVIARTW